MKPEYTQGPEALENFKRLATAILRATAKKEKRQTKKSASGHHPKLCKLGPDLLKPF
jgi:hypothetical protein